MDRALLLTAALAAIDAPHVQFMCAMDSARARPREAGDTGIYGTQVDEVVMRQPALADVATVLRQTLLGLGLIEDATGGATFVEWTRRYALSPLGRELVTLLRTEEEQAE